MKKILLLSVASCLAIFSIAQPVGVNTYPTNWWVNMANPKLQLMVHAAAIGESDRYTTNYPGVSIIKVHKAENGNYVFLDLLIAPKARTGIVNIRAHKGKSFQDISFELKQKHKSENGRSRVQGVTAADIVYLVMPDRFSNGDSSNDRFDGMRDNIVDRSNSLLRHGGDLQGIINHLDYIKDLGMTTLWLTPVVENDMPAEQEPPGPVSGYHGYWITDHYVVDKRLGGNQAYLNMVEAAHRKGLKVIQDAVYNHVGKDHWFIRDLPMKDWINNWPAYQGTHHREEIFIDPYASAIDKKIMIDGWFVPHLPDLNLRNPFMANYIIQNTIWATEEFGIDGWRVDTYKYNDEAFLNNINNALLKEFPSLTIFGEVTANTVPPGAYFTANNMKFPFQHNTQGITDFPLMYGMLAGLNEPFGWTNGVNKLYMALAQDGLYQHPEKNSIFLDNHDADRVLTVVGENSGKLKMGMNWLLTLRGIPQIYYGTEILMKNSRHPSDGQVRLDFPGGWAGDTQNKFNKSGRSADENQVFDHIKKLADFRKTATAITRGKLMQYIPESGLYIYFRYDKKQTVMVVSNTGSKPVLFRAARFEERVKGYTLGIDIQTGNRRALADFEVAPGVSTVYELQ